MDKLDELIESLKKLAESNGDLSDAYKKAIAELIRDQGRDAAMSRMSDITGSYFVEGDIPIIPSAQEDTYTAQFPDERGWSEPRRPDVYRVEGETYDLATDNSIYGFSNYVPGPEKKDIETFELASDGVPVDNSVYGFAEGNFWTKSGPDMTDSIPLEGNTYDLSPLDPPPIPGKSEADEDGSGLNGEKLNKVVAAVGGAFIATAIGVKIAKDAIDGVVSFTDSVQSRNREYSQVSSMNYATTLRQTFEEMRNIRLGEYQAGSATALTREEEERKKKTEPLRGELERFENLFAATLERNLASFLDTISPVTEAARAYLKKINDATEDYDASTAAERSNLSGFLRNEAEERGMQQRDAQSPWEDMTRRAWQQITFAAGNNSDPF